MSHCFNTVYLQKGYNLALYIIILSTVDGWLMATSITEGAGEILHSALVSAP